MKGGDVEMNLAQALLECPRGRHFCAALASQLDPTFELDQILTRTAYGIDDHGPSGFAATADALDGLQISTLVAASAADALTALIQAVGYARYWQPPDEIDNLLAAPELDRPLRRIAEALTSAPNVRWFGSPADLTTQRSVWWFDEHFGGWGTTDRPTVDWNNWRTALVEEENRAARDRPADPTAPYSGHWWSTPMADGSPETTRATSELPALALDLTEDDMGWNRARVLPVEVFGQPRVFEITSPGDWACLVEHHPIEVTASRRHDWYNTTGRSGAWHMPDWSSVAEQFDAVHLTIWGYLTTAGNAVPVHLPGVDSASVLAGWTPDATHWLNPKAVGIGSTSTEYHRNDDGEWTMDDRAT
jgi:hypothetical protein